MTEIKLVPLEENDRNQFILDNQEAFRYGAMEEFGCRDEHFEEDGEIISRKTIEASIDGGTAYRIIHEGKIAGGLVVRVEGRKGELELLFVSPKIHSRGIGYGAWCAVEKMYPQVKVWETCTPYFEKRNIHFYVNRCGFHIVEFFNGKHKDPKDTEPDEGEAGEMFLFRKVMGWDEHVKSLLDDFSYISLRERPDIMERAAEWFHSKWSVPKEAYLCCMEDYLKGDTEYGWYLCLDGEKIAGGLGVIENDFHDRKDLTPNICAVYTEKEYRCRGIAGRLLDMAVEDLRSKGITPVYLLTDHTGFYERYGWEFYCMARGDGEDKPSRMYIHR